MNKNYRLHLVKKKNEYGEYKIIDKVLGEQAAYYTDDWDDAVDTFELVCKILKLDVICLENKREYWAFANNKQ